MKRPAAARLAARNLVRSPELLAATAHAAASFFDGKVTGRGDVRTVAELGRRLQEIGAEITSAGPEIRGRLTPEIMRNARRHVDKVLGRRRNDGPGIRTAAEHREVAERFKRRNEIADANAEPIRPGTAAAQLAYERDRNRGGY